MNDVVVKNLGNTVGAGVVTVNDVKHHITSSFQLLSHIYNAMYDEDKSFTDIVKSYIGGLSKDELDEIADMICNKLENMNPPQKGGNKWDGYSQ